MKRFLAAALALAAAQALSTAAWAADADLQRCRAMADKALRLSCYDAIPLDAPAVAADAPPMPAAFGFEHKAAQAVPELIESRVPGLFEGWGPKTRIRLENGQVWQVIDESSAVIDKRDPKVRIARGALGSFIFEVDGRNQTARVRRVE